MESTIKELNKLTPEKAFTLNRLTPSDLMNAHFNGQIVPSKMRKDLNDTNASGHLRK